MNTIINEKSFTLKCNFFVSDHFIYVFGEKTEKSTMELYIFDTDSNFSDYYLC